ncbi:4Fe-4S binding protein [Aestuariibaculum lutulentum]|uniref:Thiamine pyrophosphate-dependent enzyme n=1 Tax=Aestuariibaculum lutulentum TaxID=2920935 RepID=A0ABS9RMY6_9FLAO|nr:4Fe-4S binding protein [Aestuariibaculum lutulentum]MCH4553474.1 thiamine pyrophosphate-dependent enzyme [Aestuariibaculum lutulentum]
MKTSKYSILNANQAVAKIAFKTNEVMPIYPITPASEMSELVEQWAAENKINYQGLTPSVYQMQSEAGVAGAMHGALITGALSSTFTASQGLLLMLPNLYKIAGELTPNVIHVATRSIATHALSVFGDHSDVMAVRQSGYAMLASASVQEAHDFALIAQVASLKSRIPFIHFFDGFRTSHEISKIKTNTDEIIQQLTPSEAIQEHRDRALNTNKPTIKGTSQAADVFFQSREATNTTYNSCPDIVQHTMEIFETLTGRPYKLFEYIGHPEAESIIISMASSTETIEETIQYLNQKGEKLGLIKVKLYRPFSTKHLIEALPKTCKSVAVLDRTKEPGSNGEPLYLDVLQSLTEAFQTHQIPHLPQVIGGRYGLSSKEFTPTMVKAIFDNLKENSPKNHFTVSITDDVTHLSLTTKENLYINQSYQAIFYETKRKSLGENFKQILKLIGSKKHTFIQGYTECDYKKSNSRNVSHLRIDNKPIKAPYLIENANFIATDSVNFIENDMVIETLKPGGLLLVNSDLTTKNFWTSLSQSVQTKIIKKSIILKIVNIETIQDLEITSNLNVSALQVCFLALTNQCLDAETIALIKQHIQKVDTSEVILNSENSNPFSNTFLGKLIANQGHSIPVSALPLDGTYPTNTSQFNSIEATSYIPEWKTDLCTQCGVCSMACPQGALRIKVFDDIYLNQTPKGFKSIKATETEWEIYLLNYTIQINPNQCNGCNNCVDACSSKALKLTDKQAKTNDDNWDYFNSMHEFDRTKIDTTKMSQQQLQEPLFKYPMGVKGCGEAPYLKLLSQLYGDRLLIANATGASSIFGGALPTTPWSTNNNGQGPAWANSLFEDNAEFGLGYKLSIDQQLAQARQLLKQLSPELPLKLVYDILNNKQTNGKEIHNQRTYVNQLKTILKTIETNKHKQLYNLADNFIKKSIWIVGGDGWAYDIGFSGIDHVLASGKNVNILVLDNEVYDNTGGQASKATPFGAEAKFTFNGNKKQKKDLGLMAVNYGNVYVASIAIGANPKQTLKAFNEAESFNGPSIIIAYCHSESHGIDMTKPSQYHKAAVQSGQWLLYRHDPRRLKYSQPPLQLDSKAPSIKITDYLKLEQRFSKLFKDDNHSAEKALVTYQNHINNKFKTYLNISQPNNLINNKITYTNN